MSSKESARQDIARQFDLPERASKIQSLLKESDVYCICRSSDSTRFMICCDNCEEWYHGDCIKITDSDAKRIKHYFCDFCRDHNPSLKIEYKKSKTVPTHVTPVKERSTLSSSNLNVESSPASSTKDNLNSKRERNKGGRPRKITLEQPSSASKEKTKEKRKYSRRCGTCTGCTLDEDCGKCDVCKSNARRRKYDSNAKSSKKCRQRQCLHSSKSRPRTYSYDSDDYEPPDVEIVRSTSASKVFTYSDSDSAEEGDWMPKARKPKDKEKSSRRSKSEKEKKVRDNSHSVEKHPKVKKYHRSKRAGELWEDWSSAGEISEDDPGGKQCLGPQCVNETRPNSKYCSDDCGLKLAHERIYTVLPGRIQQWSVTPCEAEENNKKTLEDVRSKQAETKISIKRLEDKRAGLDNHIEQMSRLKMDPDDDDDDQDDDGSIYCITCGHEVSIKTCMKHMEKCYNKYESQTSFASCYVTKLEGTPIFCDSYNIVAGTYCKRLKVLCPEHTKEPKVRDTEVCGCPLVKNLTATGGFCRVAKKKCNRHFCWEKLRRAEIDMERVRCWMKLDELYEQERNLRQALTNRAGVMGLLLHSTFDHDLSARILRRQREMEEQQRQRDRRISREKERSKRNAGVRSMDVKPQIDHDLDEILFKEPLPSKRDKANRRTAAVVVKQEDEPKREIMTASKLYKRMTEESDF